MVRGVLMTNFLNGDAGYTAEEKADRKNFAREYIKDYDAFSAALRCGYMDDLALEIAKDYLSDPYVAKLIDEYAAIPVLGASKPEDPDIYIPRTEEEMKHRVLASLYREAHSKGGRTSQSARVTALTRLSIILGMDKPEAEENEDQGGVMVIPSVKGLDQWEEYAVQQQTKLKEQVKE